jgi:hypothetical protein
VEFATRFRRCGNSPNSSSPSDYTCISRYWPTESQTQALRLPHLSLKQQVPHFFHVGMNCHTACFIPRGRPGIDYPMRWRQPRTSTQTIDAVHDILASTAQFDQTTSIWVATACSETAEHAMYQLTPHGCQLMFHTTKRSEIDEQLRFVSGDINGKINFRLNAHDCV